MVSVLHLTPVHERHHHVAEQKIDGSSLGPGNAERLEGITGLESGIAFGLEHIDRDPEHFGLVIHDEDGFH